MSRPMAWVTGWWLALSVAAAAANGAPPADIVGAWALSYTTMDGVNLESTLTVKMDGDKLAGTISSTRGSVALDEIAVNGDDVTFAIVRVGFGDTIRIQYAGKLDGDTMRLKIKVGAREPLEATARRVAGTGRP